MRLKLQNLRLFDGRQLLALLALVLIFCALVGGMLIRKPAVAASASTINFQARLMNASGSIAPDGPYNIEFKIYDASTSSGSSQGSCSGDVNCLWTETRTGGSRVTVANGYITVNLGSVNAFGTSIDWSKDLWLTMNIGGSGGSPSWDGEMTPRLKLTAVPYAFSASVLSKTVTTKDVSLQFASSFGQDTLITLPDPGASTATVCYQNATACGFAPGAASSYIQNSSTVQTNANIAIQSASDSSITALFKNRATQSADIIRVVDSSNSIIFNIDTFGVGRFGYNVNVAGYLGIGDTTAVTSSVALRVYTANPAHTGIEVNGDPGQTGDLLVLNAPGTRVLHYTADGTLGLTAGSGQSADLIHVTDSSGATLATIGPTGDTLIRTATDSATALRVQKSTGSDTVLAVDTSANRVVIGNGTATSGADTTLLVLDSSTTANGPTGVNGGMFYDTTLNKFRCYQNSGWTDCIASGGITTVGAFSGSSQVNGASISGSTITFGPADGTNPGMVSTGSQTFAGDKTFSGNVIVQGTGGLTFNTGTGGDITFANNEKIDNDTDGTINLQANSGALTLLLTGTSGTITNSAGTLTLNSFNNTLTIDSSDTTLSATGLGTINLANSVALTTGGTTRLTLDNSNNLYLGNGTSAASPNNFAIKGTGSATTAVAGGSVTIQGGDATTGTANGGNLTLTGGSGFGGGVRGLVNLGPSSFSSVTNTTCSSACTLDQANVDNYASVVVNSSGSNIITVPDPTTTSAGRIIYIIGANGSSDFTLRFNAGGTLIDIAMRQNSTATLYWNGTDWTAAGAGNSTTLQAAYGNGSNPSNVPEIKLDSTHSTIDIQDADSTIGADLFNIRGSNSLTLGTVLFGVSNTGKVTVQNITDQDASLRVLNAAGNYITNVNSAGNYVINNGVRSLGNEIINAGFEAGGQLTSGEQGWNGPAQGSIVNSAANAHGGNWELTITPNATNLDVYPGSYFAVQPGDTVYVEAWVKNAGGSNGDAGVQLTFYDKDYANPTTSTNYSGLPGTSYVLRTVSATVPAGKYYVRPSATVRSTSSTGTFYFDDFYLKKTSEQGPALFKNSADSSSAFVIQSAGAAQTLFTADTTNNNLKVGDSDGASSGLTVFVLDSATSDPSTLTNRNGGLFYRSDNNSLKAIVGGAVVDVCTTATVCSGYGASAGSVVGLQATTPGTVQTGNFAITGTGILTTLQTQSLASGNTDALTIKTGNAASGNSGNLTIDVGTASGTKGSISIGSTGVTTTMPGNLIIQGANAVELGTSSTSEGTIKMHNSAGSNTITLSASSSNPTSSWTFSLPQNKASNSGYCLKASDTIGGHTYGDCGVGATVTLQDVYNNSSSPATMTLASAKDVKFVSQEAATDAKIIFDLQCTTCSAGGGQFVVQNGGTPVLTVKPNSGGIILGTETQIGSGSTTDSVQVNFHLDTYDGATDIGTCDDTTNQGALYYNHTMGSLRGCLNGDWVDVSNPDTLGLLTFGIIPSTGANPYDLPSLITPGVSGPCKVSRAGPTSVSIEACTAYSGGRRVNVTGRTLNTNVIGTLPDTNLTNAAPWGHICLTGADSQPAFTNAAGTANAYANQPTFSITAPILCLASVKVATSGAANIDDIYDVRTFSSTIKEAVNLTTPADLGMLVDAASGGLVPSASCSGSSSTCSGKLYGVVIASNGSTSTTTPNAIVASVGPAFIKATSGNAGEFVKSGPTSGYAATNTTIPNNAFYYSPGNTRTSWSTTCTTAANCQGSLYVNFIVR